MAIADDRIVLDGPYGTGNEKEMEVWHINVELNLSEEQRTSVVFHSFQNVLTSLVEGIRSCVMSLDNPSINIFTNTLAVGGQIKSSLNSLEDLIPLLLKLPELVPVIVGEIVDAKKTCDELRLTDPDDDLLKMKMDLFSQDLTWIENDLIPIILTRVGEMVKRLPLPANTWIVYKTDTILQNMKNVMLAVAHGSRHATGLVFSEAERTKQGMHVLHLNIKGHLPGAIEFPPIFQDIMRDILMNARKYCPPGGSIWGDMINDGQFFTIKVRDNGPGMLPEEVGDAVKFGFRGTNTKERRTLGGGYGLTKAYFFTKQFGGDFTIKSKLGVGAVFQCRIPVPASFRVILPPEDEGCRAVLDEKQRDVTKFEDSSILAMPKDTYLRFTQSQTA
ncbi:putative sensor histidine kinase [Blattamonas nauphoetae]|uniref:Sensor histidine kinase n=1 Tax=Blattamonas nauphoetae TaxID=2049346 RepID=A0ABQ9YJM6_9EUKA|nr:putative sensor histidine kinase [Blattamonas nauphoetae]